MEVDYSFFLLVILIPIYKAAKLGPYYCEPYNIVSHKNNRTDLVTAYFYLQQINQTTVVVVGEFDVKKTLGPIMAHSDVLFWAGNTFKRPSGDGEARLIDNICVEPVMMGIFTTTTPEHYFDIGSCSLGQGEFKMVFNFDEILHTALPVLGFDPLQFIFEYMVKRNEPLFGFTIEVKMYELALYEYTLGREKIP